MLYFSCLLHSDSKPYDSINELLSDLEQTMCSCVDVLSMVLNFFNMAAKSNRKDKNMIRLQLLKAWLTLNIRHELWKAQEDVSESNKANNELRRPAQPSFFAVLRSAIVLRLQDESKDHVSTELVDASQREDIWALLEICGEVLNSSGGRQVMAEDKDHLDWLASLCFNCGLSAVKEEEPANAIKSSKLAPFFFLATFRIYNLMGDDLPVAKEVDRIVSLIMAVTSSFNNKSDGSLFGNGEEGTLCIDAKQWLGYLEEAQTYISRISKVPSTIGTAKNLEKTVLICQLLLRSCDKTLDVQSFVEQHQSSLW